MGNGRPCYIPPHFRRRFPCHRRSTNENNAHSLVIQRSSQHRGYQTTLACLARWNRLKSLLEYGFRPLHFDVLLRAEIERLLFELEIPVTDFPCLSFRFNFRHFDSSFCEDMSTYSGYQLQLTLLHAIEDWHTLKECNYTSANVVLGSCLNMLERSQERHSAFCDDSSMQSSKPTFEEVHRIQAEVNSSLNWLTTNVWLSNVVSVNETKLFLHTRIMHHSSWSTMMNVIACLHELSNSLNQFDNIFDLVSLTI